MMTKLLYVDLETGGIPVSTGIYEVGLIATENGRIVDTLTIGKIINPSRLSEGMGQGYACISDDERYINQFKQFVAKYPYPFVAHNAQFDKDFLVHYGWVESGANFIDTLALFRKHIPKTEIGNYKLGTIMDYLDVQVDGTLHTAISDLKGLVECVNKSDILNPHLDNQKLRKSKWWRVSTSRIETEGITGKIYIQGFMTSDSKEKPTVIAVMSGDMSATEFNYNLEYLDDDARTDKVAQDTIDSVISSEPFKKPPKYVFPTALDKRFVTRFSSTTLTGTLQESLRDLREDGWSLTVMGDFKKFVERYFSEEDMSEKGMERLKQELYQEYYSEGLGAWVMVHSFVDPLLEYVRNHPNK